MDIATGGGLTLTRALHESESGERYFNRFGHLIYAEPRRRGA